MKILYITTMYPVPEYPQQGIFCHEQVKALMQAGVDVTVAVPVPFYGSPRQPAWDHEGVHIRYVHFFKLPGTADFHETGKNLYRRLKRVLDLKQFDLFHADAPLPSGYAAMLAAKAYGKPFAVHGHGLDVFLDRSYEGTKNCRKIAAVCAQVYEAANAVIGVSQKVIDRVQARVDISDKAHVVYNGVDTDAFYPAERERTDGVTITSIGNLIPIKGHDLTLRAVRQLVNRGHRNIRLNIAGRGPEEEKLKALASELEIGEYVRFLGYIPYAEVAKLLQKSDIFVLPSYYEALGCVYLEAMACGLPAIGCRENGIDEVIEDGKTGCLIGNRSLDQLTAALELLLEPASRAAMGINARKAVAQRYQWKHSAEKLRSVYSNYLK